MPYFDGRPDLAVGDSGEWVVELQHLLETLGLYVGIVDGYVGERTVAAVRDFGLVHHVDLDDDVLVGERVWTALVALTEPAPPRPDHGDGGHPADPAWVWHDDTWTPAQQGSVAAAASVAEPHVSDDGHWRWVDDQWQPNA